MALFDAPLYRRIATDARPFTLPLVGVLVLELLSTPLALLTPIPLQIAVDSVVHHRPVPEAFQWAFGSNVSDPKALLISVCLVSLAIAFLSQIRGLFATLLATYTGQNLMLDFRSRLFRHAQNLSLTYHTERGSTDALYRIQSDASAIESIITDVLIPSVTSLFTLFAMLFVLLRLDWKIGCIALVASPILFLLSRLSRPILRGQSKDIKKEESLAMGIVQEVLGLLRVVKAFCTEEQEQSRFTKQAGKCVKARLRLNLLEGSLGVLINMVTAGGVALVLFIGISEVLSGALTLGLLLLVLSYVADLYAPLRTVSRKMVAAQSQLASLERAYSFLDEPTDVEEKPDAKPLERAKGRIAFNDVSFRYNEERAVLDNVSFAVEPGSRVGIVGTTGSGKSTIVNLLLRLYDPESGTIFLDGVDARDYNLRDLRNQFAVVFQEPILFAASIEENIAYGCPGAKREAIEEAARAANVHDFISRLPKGYETKVGERGNAVSGGERQRIALARAFLKNAPILVLDEPTSSIDSGTEAVILEAMNRLMEGRTTFIIAHRLNTIEECDVILQLAGGHLTQVARVAPRSARRNDEPLSVS